MRGEGGGGDLSPWCPGSLATGWGWRKAALNGVSVETGKANTAAWATLACWGGVGVGGTGWGRGLAHLSLPLSPLSWALRAHGFLDLCPTESRKGVGSRAGDKFY